MKITDYKSPKVKAVIIPLRDSVCQQYSNQIQEYITSKEDQLTNSDDF